MNGAANSSPSTYNVETEVTLKDPGARNGFVFVGWFSSMTEGEKATKVEKGSKGEKTFYARWQISQYNINYENLYGTSHTNKLTYTVTEEVTYVEPAPRAGYTFAGWYTSLTGGEKATKISVGTTGEQTVFARWYTNYKINFENLNGVNHENIEFYTAEQGRILNSPAIRSGYTFEGWYSSLEEGEKVTEISIGETEEKTFYARWMTVKYTRCNRNGEPNEKGEYLVYGEFPQTLKEDSVTVGEMPDSRGYFQGSDGFYYEKKVAKKYVDGELGPLYKPKFDNGQLITDGETYYFKVEPIIWKIVDIRNEAIEVYTEKMLAGAPFSAGEKSNNYETSFIRTLLNSEVINKAFTEEQRASILITEVDNSPESTGSENPHVCPNTNDKIYLLSYAQYVSDKYGLVEGDKRLKDTSDYYRATGGKVDTNLDDAENYKFLNKWWWWLRSPYANHSEMVQYVAFCGYDESNTGPLDSDDKLGIIAGMRLENN